WPPARESAGDSFTSIVSWRGAFGPIEYQGKTYGLRVHEFRKFALPRLSGRPFQLALDIHPTEVKDRALLTDNGWSLVDPGVVAGDPWVYQDYERIPEPISDVFSARISASSTITLSGSRDPAWPALHRLQTAFTAACAERFFCDGV